MKKILWLIFLLVIGSKVEASEVYYSNYSDFSSYQEEEVVASDIVDVAVEERYLWYKKNEVIGDYKLYNQEDKFSDECYLTNYSNWQEEKVDNVGYVYEERNKYEYTKAEAIRYIHLYNLQGSYGAFRITELMVKVNGKEIDYDYTCDGCLAGFDDYIHNGIYEENMSYIDNGGSLIIDLGKEYPLNQIETIFYIFDLGPSDKKYTIGYSKDKTDIFVAQGYLLRFADYHWSNAKKEVKKITDFNIDISEWTTKEISYEEENHSNIVDVKVTKQYRYQEKWCKVIEEEKEYYNEYSNTAIYDYIYKDEASKKNFYRYRLRDKLEINIHDITDKNFDLNDFIVFSTDKVNIQNNIDWQKNGNYEVKFILNDIVVTKDVKLNILENTIFDLEQEIADLKEEIISLEDYLHDKEQEYEAKINELNEKLDNCQKENSCLKETLKQKEELLKKQEQELQDLIDKVNRLQAELISKIDELTTLKKDNQELQKEIISLEEEINNLKKEAVVLNNDIALKYREITELTNANEFYQNKIAELNEDLKLLNEAMNNKLKEKDNIIKQYESKCLEDPNLDNKLSDYILKINGHSILDITIIVLLFILLIYIIFKNQKFKK